MLLLHLFVLSLQLCHLLFDGPDLLIVLGLEFLECFGVFFLADSKALLAQLLVLVGLVPFALKVGQLSLLMELSLLELSLILDGTLFQVLDTFLQLALVDVDFLTARNR